MDFFAGIDVGAQKKGFHVALKALNSSTFFSVSHLKSPLDIIDHLSYSQTLFNGRCLLIAIDSPRQALLPAGSIRSAEKEVFQSGYRVFWTPDQAEKSMTWMKNGQYLWELLNTHLPHIPIVECFPTVCSDALLKVKTKLDLNLLSGKTKRKFYKDYLDACYCCLTAEKVYQNQSRHFGRDDILNPIYSLPIQLKKYCLAIVISQQQILLGLKKKGFGQGKWNGFGGKVEKGETTTSAVKRELFEECGLKVRAMTHNGKMYFSFTEFDYIMEVDIFLVHKHANQAIESDEMLPEWFDLDQIPYSKMWKDDPFWLPLILKKKKFIGHFNFTDQESLISYSLEEVDRLP